MMHQRGLCTTMGLLRLRFFTGFVLLWILPLCVAAQDDLNIHGVVSDAITSSKINGVKVVVNMDGSQHNSFTTRANGKYEFYLDVGHRYELLFSKDGYVTRSIVIDSRNVPPEVLGAGIIMPTDMSMYAITEAMANADLSVFNKPIGKSAYDPSQSDLVWDFTYTNTVKNEINAFMRDIEKKQKELDKQADADTKAAEKEQGQFEDLVAQGDVAMSKDRFEDAVLNYQAALKIVADDGAVKAKLGDAETKWNAKKATEKLASEYNAALDAGDGFMRTGELNKAVTSYETALGLKPKEKYPQEQIVEANRLLEEKAANRAKQEQFNDLMSAAAVFVDEKEYSKAIDKYDEALAVIPGDKEAESKRNSAKDALAAQQKAEQRRAEYEETIAAADALFTKENYEAALPKYRAASEIMPDEAYPGKQIDICENKMTELADAQKKQAEFDALMASGDKALAATQYEAAIGDFEGALALLPNDPEAKSRLKQAQDLFAEVQAERDLQKNYDAAIEAADAAFDNEDYNSAKDKYLEAKNLIPKEEYPTAQIAKIDRKLSELADAEATRQAYDEAMLAAQSAMDTERYSDAVNQYGKALAVLPKDKPAEKGRAGAQEKLEDQLAKMESQTAYDELISSADKKLAEDQLQAAITDYQAAQKTLPNEKYPGSQIETIQGMIADREAADALQAQFDGFVKKGDEATAKASYHEAIDEYTQALELRESTGVKAKLEKAKEDIAALEAQQDLEQRYAAAIDLADEHFKEDKLAQAKTDYQRASDLKPDETYPNERLSLIDERLAEKAAAEAKLDQQARIDQVNALVSKGDQASGKKDFDTAIDRYTEALEILSDRQDVSEKLAQAERDLLASQEKQAVDEVYADAIAQADLDFDKSKWEDAISGYRDALEIKPDEKHPKDRIAEAETELDRLAQEEAFDEQVKLQRDFDKFIANGDRNMSRNKFEKARDEYSDALKLIPESTLAQEKLDQATHALQALQTEEADLRQYEAMIEEADALFDEESYEIAKLSYLDASELMPDREYPRDRVKAIELLLEKQRLHEKSLAQDAIREEYDGVISRADNLMASREYEDARQAYEEAREIIPEETYPRGQIERIGLLMEKRDRAQNEREVRAERKEERPKEKPRDRERVEYNRVNADSEDQAEQFMREAREAQEKERYERIKKQKEEHRRNEQDYLQTSNELREGNMQVIQSLRSGADGQFAEAKAIQDEKIKNSRQYKKAILTTATKRSEMDEVQIAENYNAVRDAENRRADRMREQEATHRDQGREVREANDDRQAKIAEWHRDSYGNRKTVDEEIKSEAAQRAQDTQRAKENRAKEAKEINRKSMEHRDFITDLNKSNMSEVKRQSTEIEEQKQLIAKRQSGKNEDKVEEGKSQMRENRERYENALLENRAMAEDRRKKNDETIRDIETGRAKTPYEYHRSALAQDYPQGVTEESSTLGNKVIITRVVVKGNRGDEYKKVVDKAGNYYFKNGQSISQHTWDRETLQAFNKSKD